MNPQKKILNKFCELAASPCRPTTLEIWWDFLKSGWKWESLLVVWHENCCYCTVWESVWRLLLLYVYENCCYCTVWELYENWCCCVEPESVAIVLYCCNTRREPTLKLSNETLSKQAEKAKKKEKEVYHMIPKFASTESDNNPTIPNNNKSTSHSLQRFWLWNSSINQLKTLGCK